MRPTFLSCSFRATPFTFLAAAPLCEPPIIAVLLFSPLSSYFPLFVLLSQFDSPACCTCRSYYIDDSALSFCISITAPGWGTLRRKSRCWSSLNNGITWWLFCYILNNVCPLDQLLTSHMRFPIVYSSSPAAIQVCAPRFLPRPIAEQRAARLLTMVQPTISLSHYHHYTPIGAFSSHIIAHHQHHQKTDWFNLLPTF